MWYWNSPFVVSDSDLKSLKEIGVKTLYVREATFTTDGKNLLTEFHEHWDSPSRGFKIVLVYNFDAGVIRHFGALSTDALISGISDGVEKTASLVKGHGLAISGIQFDFDCPTRLLSKYASLLGSVRSELVKRKLLTTGQSFSSTALQTWLKSPQYAELAKVTDFLAPQFYESRTGRTVESVAPIADVDGLGKGLALAEQNGTPFFAGIAAYGHALLYNSDGKLSGVYHGLQPSEALRHPSLEYRSVTPLTDQGKPANKTDFAGEDLLKVAAVEGDLNERGKGDTIAYLIPSAEMLKEQIDAVRAARATHCRGIILYRFPSESDEMALPLSTDALVMRGGKPAVNINGSVSSESVPWALIGGAATSDHSHAYRVKLRNTGNEPTRVSRDGASAMLLFSGEGIDAFGAGDFDAAYAGRFDEDKVFRGCAKQHANALLLLKFRLGPGQTVTSGPIATSGSGAVASELRWKVQAVGGFQTVVGQVAAPKVSK